MGCVHCSTAPLASPRRPARPRRQREALATPLAPLEQRALHEHYASLMRPSWALDPGAFGQVRQGRGGGIAGSSAGSRQPAAALDPAWPLRELPLTVCRLACANPSCLQGSAPGQRPNPQQQAASGPPLPPPVLPHGLAF